VVIRGSRIVSVGPVEPPPGARIIDGTGLFALPGLADLHAHLLLDPERWMPLFLTCGVTTVMNLLGTPGHLALRDRVRRGELIGPRIFTSGPFANQPGITTPEQAVGLVADQKRAGYDVIKLHGNLTLPTYRALLDEAGRQGIAVLGHAPRNLPFDAVLDDGRQRAIAHLEELVYTHFRKPAPRTQQRIDDLAARIRQKRLWMMTTVALQGSLTRQWGRRGEVERMLPGIAGARWLTTDLRRTWIGEDDYGRRNPSDRDAIQGIDELVGRLLRALHGAGVRLVLGTDTPLSGMVPGHSLIDEIDRAAGLGLGRREALRAATGRAGDLLAELVPGVEPSGRLLPGARADLLLLPRDPLAAPFTCEEIRGVVAAGRFFGAAELQRLRQQVAATPSRTTRAVAVAPAVLAAHAGAYSDGKIRLVVKVEDGVLVAVHPLGGPARLFARGPDEYQIADSLSEVILRFSSGGVRVYGNGVLELDARRER
jgi:hypothetical protein